MKKQIRSAFDQCYGLMVSEHRCDAYVKTIYVGFSIGDEMVAAIYPRGDWLEIALALPENVEGAEFRDGTHLTWPTMPVSVEVRTASDVAVAKRHLGTAATRVAAGEHRVRRPNEHFIGRVKRGNSGQGVRT